ncbi:MAG: hypothetical protein WEA56_11890 [Balneolaceae bacterium]
MTRLTKQQALDFLPSVVDQEASEDEKLAFLSFIEKNEDVRKQYESALRVKKLISSRCPTATAPERLKKEILSVLVHMNPEDQVQFSKYRDCPPETSSGGTLAGTSSITGSLLLRYLSATAVILVITLLIVDLLDRTSSHIPYETYVVEQFAAEHFMKAGGLIDPHFATQSTQEAEKFIIDQYGLEVIIPEIRGTQFAGVVMADFYDGFEVPLLEYEQPAENETIYIFAFNVNDLETNRFLQRDEQAVNTCKLQNDFYVLEVGDHHVVSWLWQDKWYTAISNFNGYDLASLVEPLNYTP